MGEEMLEALLNAVPLPALAIDGSERIVAANAEALTLIGQQARGRNYVTMLRQPAMLDAIEATLQDGRARTTQYLGNDGAQDTTFRVSVRAVPGVGQRRAGVALLSFEDITHLEQTSQMRRDFVANASHELRTPLTALMGFIETLRGPARNDPAAAERFLDIMQDEAARMNRLVGDLMSLNRVEGDERVRPTETVVLNDVLDSTLRTLRTLAGEAHVTLEPAFGDAVVQMNGDADQLKQVFTNLIENAIKYGGAGGKVTVRMTQSAREPALRAPGVRVQIIDYGPGIDPQHLPRLTERFYRVDDHRSRALGGTGLGLAIVKHIINRHRGRLRVESDLGQGATFTVILPVRESNPVTSG
ncbi:ATP-binding protein [uncultured Tateyamaria sp.]|uniref:sensor histidine kinase n=1 Tax=uncultured Tateyamaria sp. TaxID=455651 RepID=UPI00262A516E|nr:ATP-binding protein [uncultured Tateyamaria sp.]